MKKHGILLIILALTLMLAGCGGQKGSTAAGTLPVIETVTPEAQTAVPGTEKPGTAEKTTAEVTTEESTTEEPMTEEPTAEEPMTEELTTEEPTPEETTTEEPMTEPSVTEPPATELPATEPPATEPPATEPPVTEPPATEPPATEPPATEPPATEPPATEPPATEPPVTEPPATEPPATEPPATEPPADGPLVCIDPGHQGRANHDQEPVAPGSSDTKDKVSDGTYGVTTGIRESLINLTIALQLRDELQARGYRVLMTRTSEDVDISNIERAQLANNAGADAFLRLHCDNGDPSWTGCAVFCQHPYSEYNGHQYEASRRLSETVLANMCRVTGAQNRGVTEAYHYSGINWSRVPGGLFEMGFLSNAADEQRLLDPAYQHLLVTGMADGLDAYFGR